MLNIRNIEPFKFYRATQKMRYFENEKTPKKGVVTAVLSSSVENEIAFLDGVSEYLEMRYITKFFIEKSTILSLYKKRLNDINNPKKYNPIFLGEHTGNLKAVNSAVFDPSLIRGMNFVYEINHITDYFFNNADDTRPGGIKSLDMIMLLDTYLNKRFAAHEFKGVEDKVLIIPIQDWIQSDSFKDVSFFKASSTNPIVMLMNYLKDPKNVKDFAKFSDWKILLVNYNEFMLLDLKKFYEKKDAKIDLHACFMKFFQKALSGKESVSVEKQSAEDEEHKQEISAYTQAKDALDEKLKESKIDPETIDPTRKVEIVTALANEIKDDGEINKDKLNNLTIKDLENIENLNTVYGSNKSIISAKRDALLKEKLGTITYRDKTISEIEAEVKSISVDTYDIKANVINDNLKTLKSQNFERDYNEKMLAYDLMSILTFFAEKEPAMILTKLEEEDASDNLNRVYRYKVQFEDTNRKRHSFSFLLPKFYQDRYIFLNENKKDITHQLISFPIVKTGADIGQITTGYNKVFVERAGVSLSPKINKLIKLFKIGGLKGIIIAEGDATAVNIAYLTPVEYDEIAAVFPKLTIGSLQLNFTVTSAEFLTKVQATEEKVPIGLDNKKKLSYFISGTSGDVSDSSGKSYGQLSDFLVEKIGEHNPKLLDDFANIPPGSKFMYSTTMILSKYIPTILLCSSMARNGLQEVMDRAKIKYELTDKRPDVDTNTQGVYRFSDCYLVFDRYPFENSLLMNGLSEINTREFSFHQMNDKATYVDIYDMLYNKKNLIEAIENYNQLMVDPKTKDVATQLNQPTNFIDMLIYITGLLADNKFLPNNDYRNYRIRSNEIIMTFLYMELSKAYGAYRINNDLKFSIPEDAVIKNLLQSQIVDEHSVLNMYLEAENDRQVKLKGPFGLNVDEAYTIDKRAYNKTMMGVAAMATPPTGEVGVRRNLSLNYRVQNLYGFIDHAEEVNDLNGTEILSPAEMCNVYNIESADPLRSSMTVMQSKHLTPTDKMSAAILTYDMNRVMPHISNDFAFRSKQKGKVVEINNEIMVVQYEDGSFDDVDLAVRNTKNSGAGFYLGSQMNPCIKIGEKFDANQILAFDPKHNSQNDMFGDVVMNAGLLAWVTCTASGAVHEDSERIRYEFAKAMTARIALKKDLVISKYSNIKYIVEKGQTVSVNDPLLVFNDTKDEFTSTLLDNLEEGDIDLNNINNIPVISKKKGIIQDVKIYYTIPLEEMTPSLQATIKKYNKSIEKREKMLDTYHGHKNSNTIASPSKQIAADSRGKVKGIKVDDGILIEIYIEYEDVMSVGDKLANYTALKGITSYVIQEGYGPFFYFEDKKVFIDCDMSLIGSYKRMTGDFFKVGACNKLAILRKQQLADKYLPKLSKSKK